MNSNDSISTDDNTPTLISILSIEFERTVLCYYCDYSDGSSMPDAFISSGTNFEIRK